MKKIGIIIGHGGKDYGAFSKDKKYNELEYNTVIAELLSNELQNKGYSTVIHNRGYNRVENVKYLNDCNLDLIISLHCNSSDNENATGTEVIHHPKSKNGKKFAEILSNNISNMLCLKNRGAKIPFNNRGSYLLDKTKAVCVISEPFFISNDRDLKIGILNKETYVKSIVKSINEYFNI